MLGQGEEEENGGYFYLGDPIAAQIKEYVSEPDAQMNSFKDVKGPRVVEFYSPLCVSVFQTDVECWDLSQDSFFTFAVISDNTSFAKLSWQPACVDFRPHYARLATDTAKQFPKIQFYAVSCDKYEKVCEDFNVQDFPTVRLFMDETDGSVSKGRDVDHSSLTPASLSRAFGEMTSAERQRRTAEKEVRVWEIVFVLNRS